jgi:hypothetical protein
MHDEEKDLAPHRTAEYHWSDWQCADAAFKRAITTIVKPGIPVSSLYQDVLRMYNFFSYMYHLYFTTTRATYAMVENDAGVLELDRSRVMDDGQKLTEGIEGLKQCVELLLNANVRLTTDLLGIMRSLAVL